ncbi:MAG: hypothetical protein U5L45_11415 [Saprospiraceae bacterium]|nr:hypothetical protein [Saprospiraceae bacterium]
MVHFSGKARKMNHSPPLARAKRKRRTSRFRFYEWFQNTLLQMSSANFKLPKNFDR